MGNKSFTSNIYKTFDQNHEFNIFDYGHVGTFNTYKTPVYRDGVAFDSITQIPYTGQILNGWMDTLYQFDASTTHNPDAAQYTQSYYNVFSEYGMGSQYIPGYGADGVIRTQFDLQGQGLRNGEQPASVYSLFGNWGTQYTGANKQKNIQSTVKFAASADVGQHEISVGFEREERVDAYWGVGANGLWSLMRQLTNKHILERDLNNPIPVYDANGIYQDTVNFNRLYIADEQSVFDKNLRQSLFNGAYDGTEFIDIDSYDPSVFNLDFFSVNELLNGGNNYVYYFGYDAYGNLLKGSESTSLESYFGLRDANGNLINSLGDQISENDLNRNIAAFNPIYTAGYIQDKFAINDLLFNIGIRIDNYDANQMVLNDKYLLYTPKLAQEQDALDLAGGSHPSSIDGDFVVYTDNLTSPTKVVGYRDGDNWYNAQGVQISDPTLLAEAAEGQISPLLQDPDFADQGIKTDNAFTDYNPELIIMPRIAFSFPISDEAQFFAHYDVLTQRPPQSNRIEPLDYLYMDMYIKFVLLLYDVYMICI